MNTLTIVITLEGKQISGNVQFIVDSDGNRTAVVLPVEDYEEMLDIGRVARESKTETRRPFLEIVDDMRAGEIDA